MGAIPTLPDFLDGLRTALVARAGLAGVNVFTAPVDEVSMGKECIILAYEAESVEVEQPIMGRHENFEGMDVGGFIWVNKPGAGETVIAAARDRAFAILEQVIDLLDSYTTTAATQTAIIVDQADVTGYTLEQVAQDSERHCFLRFQIRARARFTPA